MSGSDWVASLSPVTVAGIGACTAVYYRLASKAGREIRTLRGQLESALRYIHELLMTMAAQGIPRRLIPRAPKDLAQADVFNDWTRDENDGSTE
jgi:hypothetical protein